MTSKTVTALEALKEERKELYVELFVRNNLAKRKYWSSAMVKIENISYCSIPGFVLLYFTRTHQSRDERKPKLVSINHPIIVGD